jgi:Response regulator of the LytR/AlgR family
LQQKDRKRYRQRFTYRLYDKILLVETAHVCRFSITNGIVYAHDRSGEKHSLREQTLQQLEQELDPDVFSVLTAATSSMWKRLITCAVLKAIEQRYF